MIESLIVISIVIVIASLDYYTDSRCKNSIGGIWMLIYAGMFTIAFEAPIPRSAFWFTIVTTSTLFIIHLSTMTASKPQEIRRYN